MKSIKIIEKNKLIPIILSLSALITFLFVLIYFYLTKPQELIESFTSSSYSKYLISFTIVLIAKIILSGYLTLFFFQKWLNKNEKHIIDIPFLLGIFYLLYACGQTFDFLLYITYFNPEIFFIDNITIVRFRYIYGIINVLPLCLLGLYLYVYKKNINKPYSEIIKIFKKKITPFLTIYLIFWIVLLFFLNNFYIIRFILIGVLSLIFFTSWIFYIAHRGRILTDINCKTISLGFFLYTISQISFPFLAILLNSLIKDGEIVSAVFMEIFSLISFIVVLIGFKTKASYSK